MPINFLKNHKFVRNTCIYGTGNILLAFVPLALTPFLTHYFSVHQFGTIDLIYTTVLIISMIANLSLDAALLRFYYEKEYSKEIVTTSVFIYSLISSILISFTSFLFFYYSSGAIFKTQEAFRALTIGLSSIPFTVLLTNELILLRAQEKALSFICASIANLVFMFFLTVFFTKFTPYGISSFFLANLISQALTSSVLFFYLKKNFVFTFSTHGNLKNKIFLYSIPLLIPSLLGTFIGSINKYFLQFYHDSSAVAIYSIGLKVSMILGLIGLSFRQAWLPYAFSISDNENAQKKYNQMFKVFLFIFFTVGALIIVFAKPLILLISNKDYLSAKGILGYLCLSSILINLSGSFFNLGILIKKKTSYLLLAYLLGIFVNLVLNFILVPRYSIIGAGISLVSGHFLITMLLFYFSRRIYKSTYELRFLFGFIALFIVFLFIWR